MKRFTLVEGLWGNSQNKQNNQLWRYLACMLLACSLGIGNAWGTEFYVWDGICNADKKALSKTEHANGEHSDITTGFTYTLSGWKDGLIDISSYTNYSTYGRSYAIQQGGTTAASYNVSLTIPSGYTASLYVVYAVTGSQPKYFGLNKSTALQPNGSNCSDWNATVSSNTTLTHATISDLSAGTYYLLGNAGNCVFAEIKVTLSSASSGKNIYLKPNGIWNTGIPRYAAYYWKSANTSDNGWVDFSSFNACTPCYKATIPSGYDKTILCRMDGSEAANNWDNKWNQTLDLTVPTGNDTCYTISSINGCTESKSCGSWGTYTAPTYTISYEGNESTSGSTASNTGIACGGGATLTANGFSKTGYNFSCWHANVATTVGGVAKAAGADISGGVSLTNITSDITMTAQWSAKNYTIGLNANGGSDGSANVSLTYNSASHAAITNPTKSGYTFAGWYSGEGGTGTLIISTDGSLQASVDGYTGAGGIWTKDATTTLYAAWKLNTPVISFSDDTNNEVSITATEGASIYYTVDGTTPTSSSIPYTAAFTIRGDKTIKAIAIKSGAINSDVDSEDCTFHAAQRVFKSGETIYFQDVGEGNIQTLNKMWVSDAGDVYAYFFDNASPTPNAAFSATVRSMARYSYGAGYAIYKFFVPKKGDDNHEWTGVLFTRGSSAVISGDGFWNMTTDQHPEVGQNMFVMSKNAPNGESKYGGSWSKYSESPVLLGDFNSWNPDANPFGDWSSYVGKTFVTLDASPMDYSMKVLDGETYYGLDSYATITYTLEEGSWWLLKSGTGKTDIGLKADEDGEYAIQYNSSTHYFSVYYPKARLKKNSYLYFDARNSDASHWNSIGIAGKYYFKYYDTGGDQSDVTVNTRLDGSVIYATVPNSDLVGKLQINRCAADKSEEYTDKTSLMAASARTSSAQNCIVIPSGQANQWSPATEWGTYCPPMSSATLSDNGTTKTAIGSGTEGSPYIVVTGTTIKVSAEAESAIDDDNMTAKYNFKVGGSSQQNSTTTTYAHEASINNTVYAMSVSAYNNYNSTDGTAANSNVIYYKALDSYTISYSAGGEDGVTGSHDSDTKYYGIDLTLPGVVFSKTGYTQTGWATSKGGDKAYNLSITNYSGNADATLYPVWTANPISVKLAKGTNGAANQSATINYDATTYASFTAVSGNTGYRCTGYYDGETQVLNADGSFAAYNVTGYITSGKWTKASDCTLTAHWEGIPYSITYKDQGDETFSGTHETGYPTSHTYGSATALKKATKAGYAFAGWYTTSTCTGDAITSIGATAYSSNITLYARWVELDLHEPGVYEKPEANDGYGRPLKLNSGHDYEVYLVTPNSSNGALYAGPTGTTINSGHAIFTSAVASTEIKGDGWVAFKMPTAYGGSESRIGSATAGTEFFVVDGSNENGAKDSRYAQFLSGDYYMRLYVKGYDEFTFLGGDYNSDDKLVVKIDGITQSYSHNTGNRNIVRFSLTDEDAHFIEITAIGTGEHYSVIRGFSLRLPDVTRYTVSAARNNDSYGSLSASSVANVRTGSTLYVDDNTFTVNGTTVTATAESGYRFENWTIGGEEVSTTATISAATTVTANFSELFTLSYDANGGTGSMSDKVGDGTVTLDANTFTKTGYIFAGWATSQANANAGTIAYADEASYTFSDNATLYAVWYKVIYEFTPATSGDSPAIDATISSSTGGTMTYTPTDGTSTGKIVYDAKGLKFTSTGNCAVTVDLDTDMDGGDIIVATLVSTQNGDGRGLKLSTTASGDAVQSWTWSPAAADEEKSFKYTITESGTFDGADKFRIIRVKDAYLTTLKVARFVAEFELTWDFNGGGSTETEGDDYTAGGSVESGTTLVYPSDASMSKPGYRFNGWSSSPSTMPASDLTLTAQWVAFDFRAVSGLDVDAGATLSSIPLSWTIPGICDLKGWTDPLVIPNNGRNEYGVLDKSNSSYNEVGDYVTANGNTPIWGQFGVGFNIPETSSLSWLSYEWKGTFYDATNGNDVILCGVSCDDTYAYWKLNGYKTLNDDSQWNESGQQVPDKIYWAEGAYPSPAPTVSQIVIYANAGNDAYDEVTFSVRNVRYGIDDDKEDIDHIVLMRKEGSAATGPADPSATKLYEGTKSHYTDASDVTGKNYYYTVFAVHANGAVSTGVSTSLTLYTITYNAGENGSGTVAADKKTHGINFTLSSSTFIRDGYTQDGWSTSDGGAKVYELGGTYSGDEAIILYPHWVADAAEDITNGNPSNGTISITDGVSSLSKASADATVTITATPTTGYNFTSWDVYKTDDASTKVSTAAATASTTFEMPAYAVTVNASFTAKTYTVTLNGNGGSGNTANVTATYNSSTLSSSITNPTLTGYIFDGWYSGEGGTGSLVISKTGALQASVDGYTGEGGIWTKDATATLYAKWITILPATLNKSNMTAVSGNMTYYSTNYFDYGDGYSGTNLDRWVDWDVYLIPCKYTVSTTGYYSTGHQWRISIKNTEEAYELPSTYEATATETGESSWDLTGLSEGVYTVRVMNIKEWGQPKLLSLTLSATVYTVTYDANGGTCGTASETVCGGSEVTLPSALGDGAFEGWYTSSDEEIGGTGDSYKPTADITLYAHWGASCSDPEEPTAFAATEVKMNRATFSITDEEDAASYDLYYASGSPSTPTSGTTETENVTTKTPTITGLSSETTYKIWVRSVCDATHKSDWVALGAEGGAFITPAPETYTITYNTDGAAEDQISDGEKTEGTNFTLSSTRYTKAGYWQVGWATSQGGSKVYNFGGTYSTDADLTLYPAWEKIAVYDPDMSTETKLTTTIGAKFGEVDRWTLTTGSTLVSTPKAVSSTAEENLTGEKYGLAFTPNWSSNALYDLGAQTTLYQLTLDIVMGSDGSLTAELLNSSFGVVKTITNDIPINNFTAWEKKTFTYTYDAGLANVRYIRIYGNGSYVVGLTRIKAEYAPTKTKIVLDNQSATSAGTDTVTATYGATTNLTSSITVPTKTGYTFGGYYTEENGEGTQLIGKNGAWIASKTNYTDGSKNWQFANPDLTLYAKWSTLTALEAGTLYEVPDMIPSGASLTSDDQFFEGLSANTKFTLIGSASSSKTPKVNNNSSNDRTIAGIIFDDGSMWFKGNATVSENIPTTFGLSFIVPSAGKLYLYFDDDDTSTNIKLAKSGTSGSKPTVSSGYSVVDVTSGTYYMYGTSTSAPYSFYGLKFVPTYDITLHDNNGGDNNGSADVAVNGTTLLDIDAPTRSGYAVTGYYAEAECTTLVADAEGNLEANVTVSAVDWTDGDGKWIKGSGATLYAKWVVVYTVTFNTNGGSSVDAITQTSEGASITMPAAPTKSGYTFNGWQMGSTYAAGASYTPTANVTAYATWSESCDGSTILKFTVNDSGDDLYVARSGGTLSLTTNNAFSELIGGDVTAVNTNTNSGGPDKMVGSDNTERHIRFTSTSSYLTLEFSEALAQGDVIEFTGNGSTQIYITTNTTYSSSIVTSTNKYTIPESSPLIDLSTIYIWPISSSTRIKSLSITRPRTCYYVTYNGNGATSGYVYDDVAHEAGSSVSAKFNSTISGFARTGYEFVEWNTEDDGSGDAYKPFAQITSSIDDDINLYAQWRIVIDANNTDFDGKDDPTQYRDVKVTKGATLTLTQNTAVRDIIVETGSTLNVNTTNGDGTGDGVTLATNSLSLVGGWGTVGNETKYDMPRVYIDPASKITKTTKTINFDIAVDNRNFYPIAVPFPVTVSDVDYVNATLAYYSNYGTSGQYVIKTYDGQKRANADMSNCWRVMRDGTKHYVTSPGEASEVMVPGQGYILRALPASGYGDYAVIRFPMKNVDDEWTNGGEKGSITVKVEEEDVTTTKNAVSVVAYENNSGGDTKLSNKGWNILGVPYMTCFVSNEIESNEANAYIKGLLNITTGEYTEDGNVYVTVPKHDFSEYDQLNFSEAKLLPGWCFFVQMDKNATLTFDIDGERASAPFRATMYEHKPTVKTGIILSGAEASDKTTILVSDKYSAADYEINADLEKMFGENSYTLATYSLMGETRLAYNAMSNSDATNVIPIGYRAPADGEYTFAINPRYAENGAFEHVNLIDYETGFVTDLLVSNYSFATERTQNDERFALNVVKRQDVITAIGNGEEVNGERTNGVQKVIINDKLYIIVEGKMYSAEGALVK